jgi:hypothetical protein
VVWASLVVAIAGVLVAAAALGWTIRRDRAQTAALDTERSERKAADEREEHRRDEELGLLRARVARDEEAVLVAHGTGAASGSGQGIDLPVTIRNVGRAPALDVLVWLALETPGIAAKDSGGLTERRAVGVIAPSDQPLEITFTQPGPFHGVASKGMG